ncbi:MAG: hypothetical protein JXM70_08050 [Pirellulales bacterium]|nr:hypothetical protein [Pirellulales bacterium]
MRFLVSPPERITDEMLQQVYLAGFDRFPWVIEATREECSVSNCGELLIERETLDSANLFVPWLVEGHGMVTLSTGSLMDRDEPYYLPLELARGKISQLKTQIDEWQSLGLIVPQDIFIGVRASLDALRRALRSPHGSVESTEAANDALRLSLDTTVRLGHCYTQQASIVRARATDLPKTLLGAELGGAMLDSTTAMSFAKTFSAARVPLAWRNIESSEGTRSWELTDRQIAWCKTHGLTVCAGPILQLDAQSLPDWLYLFEDDFESLTSAVNEFTEAAVARYRDQVDVWICASRANTAKILSLSEEEIVRLSAQLVDRTKSLSRNSEIIVSLDQPWVEYAARRQVDVPPTHFADLLMRADLGLSGLMLEINMGYHPGGTFPRDLVEFSRQLDIWAVLGMPLYISLCVPSSDNPDPLAHRQVKCLKGGGPSKSQEAWITDFVPLIMAKPYVRGVFWNQLSDKQPHDFPNGGLFDRNGRPKDSLAALAWVGATGR